MPMPRFSIYLAIVESSDVGSSRLDLRLAQHEEGRAHLLVGDLLDRIALQAQYVLPVGNGFIQALYSDAEMLDMRNFHNKNDLS